jgi:hypothetical protein
MKDEAGGLVLGQDMLVVFRFELQLVRFVLHHQELEELFVLRVRDRKSVV